MKEKKKKINGKTEEIEGNKLRRLLASKSDLMGVPVERILWPRSRALGGLCSNLELVSFAFALMKHDIKNFKIPVSQRIRLHRSPESSLQS